MKAELSELWVSTWNSATYGLRAMPINEALRDINNAIVKAGHTNLHVVSVLTSLEDCLEYNRQLKRLLKTQGVLPGENRNGSGGEPVSP